MSDITALDVESVNSFELLTSSNGKGEKVSNALESYCACLTNTVSYGFYDDDTSTAHSVITELNTQVSRINSTVSSLDTMIDNLIVKIQQDILQKEDTLSDTVKGT